MRPFFLLRATALVLPMTLSVPADALDRHMTVVNETNFAIVQLYGSNVGTRNWSGNLLGDGGLPAGASVDIDFDDGSGYCMFDLRAVFEDGDEVVKERVNVCDENRFYYRE
jgi:hypothetical protein